MSEGLLNGGISNILRGLNILRPTSRTRKLIFKGGLFRTRGG